MVDTETPDGKTEAEFLLRRYGTCAAIRISTLPPMVFLVEEPIPASHAARFGANGAIAA